MEQSEVIQALIRYGLKEQAEKVERYLDLNDGLRDENGKLKLEYSIEGIHMWANGYRVVLNNLKQYL